MILIVDCGSQKTVFIEEAVDIQMDFRVIGMKNLPDFDFSSYLGIIISGAPILITEVDPTPYLELFRPVLEQDKPILGICFGHQILGLLHGAAASRQREDRDWQTIEQLEDHPLFDKLPIEFQMMEDHCESISIPKNFKLIATSDTCVNEGMAHIEKSIFGVQFHPEVSGNLGTLLIENFVDICQKKALETNE